MGDEYPTSSLVERGTPARLRIQSVYVSVYATEGSHLPAALGPRRSNTHHTICSLTASAVRVCVLVPFFVRAFCTDGRDK